MIRAAICILIAILVTVPIGGYLLLKDDSTSASVVLEGISPATLREDNLELWAANADDRGAITAAEAEQLIADNKPGAKSRQTTLGRLSQTAPPYEYQNRLVWVVNVDPDSVSGMLPGGGIFHNPEWDGMAVRADFILGFVDATTGAPLFIVERAGPSGLYTPAAADGETDAFVPTETPVTSDVPATP